MQARKYAAKATDAEDAGNSDEFFWNASMGRSMVGNAAKLLEQNGEVDREELYKRLTYAERQKLAQTLAPSLDTQE